MELSCGMVEFLVGLLHQVVPATELNQAVQMLAHSLTQKNANAVQSSKATILSLTDGQSILQPELLLARG